MLEQLEANLAKDDLDEILAARPDFEPALWQRAHLHLQLGKFVDAKRDFDRLIEINPEAPQSFIGRSVASELSGDLVTAEADREERGNSRRSRASSSRFRKIFSWQALPTPTSNTRRSSTRPPRSSTSTRNLFGRPIDCVGMRIGTPRTLSKPWTTMLISSSTRTNRPGTISAQRPDFGRIGRLRKGAGIARPLNYHCEGKRGPCRFGLFPQRSRPRTGRAGAARGSGRGLSGIAPAPPRQRLASFQPGLDVCRTTENESGRWPASNWHFVSSHPSCRPESDGVRLAS